jgi:hypothetical protein
MKKTLYCYLLLALSLFVSCSKSNSTDDDFDFTGGFVAGTYWPFALQNTWKLVDDQGNEQIYLINNAINYEGKTYYQLKPEGTEVGFTYPAAMGSENGLFTSYYGSNTANGVTISAGKIAYINTNKAVNEVWTAEMTLNVSGLANGIMKYKHTGEIYEKNVTVTVNGRKFRDVIKAELHQEIFNSISGITTEITYDIWLALGIGIIQDSTTIDGETTTYQLTNYSVK